MRGHIRKRGDNSWEIAIELGIDPVTHKRKQQFVSFKGGKRAAEKRRDELLYQLDTGTFIRPGKTTLGVYLDKWLTDYAKPNLSPRGYERYRDIIRARLVPTLGSITMTTLRPEHIQKQYTAWLDSGLSPGSVRYFHAVLHVALQTAVKWGLVARNVADATEPPRIRRNEMHTWDETELGRFLETAKSGVYYALFYLVLFTGMRRSEVMALRWSDVDFIFGQVSVTRSLHHLKDGSYVFAEPKSEKSRRTIALPPSAIMVLREHRRQAEMARATLGKMFTEDALLFCDALNGNPLRPNTITRAWQTAARHAGVKVIRFHDARHTHASLMLKQGIHPKIVQERLGHSSIQMTLDTYSHVAPGLQEAAALSFDKLAAPKAANKETENIRWQSVGKTENERQPEGHNEYGSADIRGFGSAYRIRTGDLRLERAAS